MRRDSFLGQVLIAVARAAPTVTRAQVAAADSETARPFSQVLMAIARATPAFNRDGIATLAARRSTVQQPEPVASTSGIVIAKGSKDLLEFGPGVRLQDQRRPYRQLLAAAAAAFAIPMIIASLILIKGFIHTNGSHIKTNPISGAHGQSGSPSPVGSKTPAPSATPTVGNLLLNQLRVGDCLVGSNMNLNGNTPWPKITTAVPCNQSHTAEVFYANQNFWPIGESFPGTTSITTRASTACDNAFAAYDGIAYSKSTYTWTNIVPDASTWPTGDRALHCVAYYATSAQPAGAVLRSSIKDSRK